MLIKKILTHDLHHPSLFSYHRLIITKQLQKNKTTQDLNELENEFRIPDTQKQKKGKRKSGLKKMNLGRDASDVEAGTAESATLFDASGFQTELRGFDGGHVAAGTAADDDDVVFVRSGRESPPACQTKRRPRRQNDGVTLPSSQACHRHEYDLSFFFRFDLI